MNEPTYRIAVASNPLDHKIAPGDPYWRTFNGSFVNRELSTFDLVDAIYTGHAITTHHANNWRKAENYLCGQHLALDCDSEDRHSTLAYLAAEKFVAKYAAVIHTTISHKAEAPRARVVFVLDRPIMQAKNYTLASAALLWLFGTADRQCKDAARFYYGAPGCDLELPDNVLPLNVVKHTIEQYLATGAEERRRQARPAYAPAADQQEVADALKRIPPWGIDYGEWVQVLMAIHAEYGEGGLGLAESWADGQPGEVVRKWKTFKSGDGVTIATVFGIAKKFGWVKVHA